MTKLVECLDPLLTSRSSCHHQNPHFFDSTIPGLGNNSRSPGESSSSRRNSVGRIRFTDTASLLAVGTIHLHHHNLVVGEEPGETDTPRSGALHTNTNDMTKFGQPSEQTLESRFGSRKRFDA